MQSECEEKLVQSELASERVVTAAAVVHDHAVAQFAEHRATDSRSEQDALQQAQVRRSRCQIHRQNRLARERAQALAPK